MHVQPTVMLVRGAFAGATAWNPVLRILREREIRIDPALFHDQFAADLELEDAILLGLAQRPVTEQALADGLAAKHPAWEVLPTWQVFGDADRDIPAELFRFQVERSGPAAAHEVAGASHAIATSSPEVVAATIVESVEAVRSSSGHTDL